MDMDVSQSAVLFVISVGASALGGALGMASGIFIVPILTGLIGIDIHAAIAASIVSVIACSCGSAASYLRASLTNIRVAIVLETATTVGALSGVFLGGAIPVPALYALFAFILLLSARQMLTRRGDPVSEITLQTPSDVATALRLHSSYPDPSGARIHYRVQRVPLGLSMMYGAGLISALLGIGSGVLKIPAMDTALRLPIKVSSATSNFMIGVTAAASGLAYYVRGDIRPEIAGPIALGSVLGSVLGAKVLMSLSGDKMRTFFVCVLVVLAVQMTLASFGIHFGCSQ
jgi:uncharacterized membrane protein YfcA